MRLQQHFADDDRAIEGLPIRLVIALVVGVASLGIMMSMLGGIDGLSSTEVDAELDDNVVPITGTSGSKSVDLTVVGADGEPVAEADIIVSSGTVTYDGIVQDDTDEDGEASIRLDQGDVEFGSNQDMGTLEIEIIPPQDTDYVDDQENAEIRLWDDT